MLLDVRPDHLRMVRAILQKHVPQYDVWAFGSRAKWTAKDYSDLDLCVVSDKPLSFSLLGAMAEDFSDSDLPWKVDVVDWATTSESFRKIIERDKVVVQEAGRGGGVAGVWKTERLSALCEQIADCPHSTPMWTDSGALVLRSQNIRNGRLDLSTRSYTDEAHFEQRSRRARLKAGDLVITREAPMGEVCIIPEGLRCCLGQRMVMLRPDAKKCDSRFLLYSIQSRAVQDEIKVSEGTGSTVSNLRIPLLEALPISHPPLTEQKAIAHILGTLDDKIELNRRMNATLEVMARALFQSWFVDFDPVRAKLDGRKPTALDEATAALFPATFQDSEAGHIPKGWTAHRLPDVIEVNPRRTLKGGTVAPYLDMKNLPTQGHSAEEVIDREFSSGTKFQNGDTLLARITPCLENGKTGYVDFLEDGQIGWGSTEYIVLAPKLPLPPQFGYLLARSDALRSHAIQNMTGTSGRQRVPSECFNAFFLAVPTPEIAHRFDELTAPLMAKIKTNSDESRTLATLRDTLLPKLLSGELSVAKSDENQGIKPHE